MKGASSDESLNFLEEFSCKEESGGVYYSVFRGFHDLLREGRDDASRLAEQNEHLCDGVYSNLRAESVASVQPTDALNEKGFIPPVCNRFARLRSRFMGARYPPRRWNFSLSKSMEGGGTRLKWWLMAVSFDSIARISNLGEEEEEEGCFVSLDN